MKTKHYKEIIFDIDGTLIDTEEAIMESLERVLREMGERKREREELKWVFGIPGEVALRKLGVEKAEEANRKWNRYMAEKSKNVKPFEGIEQVLKILKENKIGMGIVTSKTREEYENEFRKTGMAEYFGTVICAEEAEKPKPDGAPIREYLKKTGAKKENTIYIGDTVYDSKCAENAGVDFAWAEWGKADGKGIKATKILNRVKQIIELI